MISESQMAKRHPSFIRFALLGLISMAGRRLLVNLGFAWGSACPVIRRIAEGGGDRANWPNFGRVKLAPRVAVVNDFFAGGRDIEGRRLSSIANRFRFNLPGVGVNRIGFKQGAQITHGRRASNCGRLANLVDRRFQPGGFFADIISRNIRGIFFDARIRRLGRVNRSRLWMPSTDTCVLNH